MVTALHKADAMLTLSSAL